MLNTKRIPIYLSLLLFSLGANASVTFEIENVLTRVDGLWHFPICYANYDLGEMRPPATKLDDFLKIREFSNTCKDLFSHEEIEKSAEIIKSVQALKGFKTTLNRDNVQIKIDGSLHQTNLAIAELSNQIQGDFKYLQIDISQINLFEFYPDSSFVAPRTIHDANVRAKSRYLQSTMQLLAGIENTAENSKLSCVLYLNIMKNTPDKPPGVIATLTTNNCIYKSQPQKQ